MTAFLTGPEASLHPSAPLAGEACQLAERGWEQAFQLLPNSCGQHRRRASRGDGYEYRGSINYCGHDGRRRFSIVDNITEYARFSGRSRDLLVNSSITGCRDNESAIFPHRCRVEFGPHVLDVSDPCQFRQFRMDFRSDYCDRSLCPHEQPGFAQGNLAAPDNEASGVFESHE
jgi:hypothetical protein